MKAKRLIFCLMLCTAVLFTTVFFNSYEVFAASSDSDFENMISGFPESYKPYLRAIHASYPNYTFVMDEISDSFDDAVSAETAEKLVSLDEAVSWRGLYLHYYDWDTGKWTSKNGNSTCASYEVIAYYMDPRNFLNTSDMYMFVQQSYAGTETEEDLRNILKGSFMEKNYTPNSSDSDDVKYGGDYAKVIMAAAKESGVSPYIIAVTIISEQGWYGTSQLISGSYPGYEGYYNFFNFSAAGSDSYEVIINGLLCAKNEGWSSIYKSIVGGACLYAEGYLNNKQDTYYYKDYNVLNGTDNYWHQYAEGVSSHYTSGNLLAGYLSDNTSANLTLRIPVYTSMPDSPCEKPAKTSKLNNYYILGISGLDLSPEFDKYILSYAVKNTISSDTKITVSVPSGASYVGKSIFSLSAGPNVISLKVESETGYTRTYKLNVTASSDCTLSISIAGGSSSGSSAGSFTDVNSSNQFYDEIQWAISKGIAEGYSDGTFRPWNSCSRIAFVVFLWRLAGSPSTDTSVIKSKYSDISGLSNEFKTALAWATSSGIVNGWKDGTFRPWNNITRSASILMIWRALDCPDVGTKKVYFTDISAKYGSEEYNAIRWAQNFGVTEGYSQSDGTRIFKPYSYMNRAAMIAFIYRLDEAGYSL